MAHQSNSCIFLDKNEDQYLTWLVETLGPVLMGSKPAELISLPKGDKELADKLTKIQKNIGKCKKVSYIICTYKSSSLKVLFYNPISLNNHLSDNRSLKFLRELGYPKDYDLHSYLQALMNKIEDGHIPDEIGVFLGYPLKDIIGFMGHPSLKLTKVNGWRVYGDPRLSDIKYKEFLDAKFKIRSLLKQFNHERVLVSI